MALPIPKSVLQNMMKDGAKVKVHVLARKISSSPIFLALLHLVEMLYIDNGFVLIYSLSGYNIQFKFNFVNKL